MIIKKENKSDKWMRERELYVHARRDAWVDGCMADTEDKCEDSLSNFICEPKTIIGFKKFFIRYHLYLLNIIIN